MKAEVVEKRGQTAQAAQTAAALTEADRALFYHSIPVALSFLKLVFESHSASASSSTFTRSHDVVPALPSLLSHALTPTASALSHALTPTASYALSPFLPASLP